MSAIFDTTTASTVSFEVLLAKMKPHFQHFARRVLRLKGDNLDDVMQELTATAYEMYRSLVQRGKEVFYTPIMRFAIGHYKTGRRFIGSSSVDVFSDKTRILGRSEICDGDVLYFLFDERTNVAKSVAFKLDFQDWYRQQSARDQEIIRDLAMGEMPSDVAKKFGVSPSRITQYRRKYAASWYTFISDKREKPDLIDELNRLAEKEVA